MLGKHWNTLSTTEWVMLVRTWKKMVLKVICTVGSWHKRAQRKEILVFCLEIIPVILFDKQCDCFCLCPKSVPVDRVKRFFSF